MERVESRVALEGENGIRAADNLAEEEVEVKQDKGGSSASRSGILEDTGGGVIFCCSDRLMMTLKVQEVHIPTVAVSHFVL